jgi:cobyrinic acid a,c-diamide synthase
MKGIIIASASSESGKTTVTAAILNLLLKMDVKTACFKAGPDFIDPMFHSFVLKKNSYNLDSYMLDVNVIKYLFNKHSDESGFSVVEGAMGLFDGIGDRENGSTAEVAEILGLPVILVINAKGVSRSIAPLILGFKNFNRKIKIAGIILNNISSESHYILLEKIITEETKIKCLGYLKKDNRFSFRSRHLGLIPVDEIDDLNDKLKILTNEAEKSIKINDIINITKNKKVKIKNINFNSENICKGLKIGIANDKAFNFYYQDNLELLRESGAKLIDFSPLNDKKLPDNINGLYIGGGYPEVFAGELSKNNAMLDDVRKKLDNGLPAYAECGGLMYLTNGIKDKEKKVYSMTGFFDCISSLTEKLQRFGYILIDFGGLIIKAHEFHYSILEEVNEKDFSYKFNIKKASNNASWQCGLSKKNVLAGYPHIHFYSNPDFFKKIVELYRR